MKNSSQTIASM